LPRALALLDRLIASLEGYTSVSATPVTAKLGHEPQTIARSTPEIEEATAVSIFHQLREFSPKPEARQAVEMLSADEIEQAIEAAGAIRAAAESASASADDADEVEPPAIPADERADKGACQQGALKTAYDLQLAPEMPDWQAKVV